MFNVQSDRLKTERQDGGTVCGSNDIHLTKTVFSFSPQYEFSIQHFVLRAEVPVRGDALWSGPKINGYVSVCPELYLNWKISALSTVRTELSYSRNIGDVLDFLTAPIQVDRTTLMSANGTASDSKYLTARAHYDFKIPMSQWFVNADFVYIRNWMNLLSSDAVDSGGILNSQVLFPNMSSSIMTQAGVTKQFAAIRTKVSLGGSYMHNEGSTMQNGKMMDYAGDSMVISPSVSSRPLDWLEFNYSGDLSRTASEYKGTTRSYISRSHDISLRLSPVQSLIFSASSEINRKQLTDDVYKTMTLLDFGVSWKHKAWKLSLDLRNALDEREYSYTVYDSVNTFTYEYALRGRELVLTVVLTI